MNELICKKCGKTMLTTTTLRRCSYCGELFTDYVNSLSINDIVIIVPKKYKVSYDIKDVIIDGESYKLYYDKIHNIYYSESNIVTDSCTVIQSSDIYNSSDIRKYYIIESADFIIRENNYRCVVNNHKLQMIDAVVKVLNDNTVTEVILPAAYCPKCNKYYILERYYEALKKYGYICCRVDTFESLVSENGDDYYSQRKDKSILMQYGYTVSKQKGLSEKERQDILDFVIDNNVLSKADVIEHIEWQISEKSNKSKNNEAVEKWKKDVNYVRRKNSKNKRVLVNSIRVKRRIKV